MTYVVDPATWPDATIIVHGSVDTLEELETALRGVPDGTRRMLSKKCPEPALASSAS
jgi:hypothetical protein